MCNKIFEKTLPIFLKQLEDHLEASNGPYICGNKLTIADFLIGGLWSNYINNDAISFEKEKWQIVDKDYPKCAQYGANFMIENQKWIE